MRHQIGAIALTIATLFAATACGGDELGLGAGDDAVISEPLPAGGDQPIPVEGEGDIGNGQAGGDDPDPGTARKVEPHPAGTVDTRARSWERVVPNADQTELTVFWTSGVAPCTVLDRVEVDTTGDAVTITVFEGAAADDPDAVCIEIAEYKAYTVELGEELGPRSILDGATDS